MTVFESLSQTADDSAKSAKSYVNASETYFKLQIFKHMALLMTFLIKAIAIGGVMLLSLTLFAVCGLLLLSKWLGSMVLACVILGAIFLFIGMLIYMNRQFINRKVLNSLSKQF